jgi:hypothetical protein
MAGPASLTATRYLACSEADPPLDFRSRSVLPRHRPSAGHDRASRVDLGRNETRRSPEAAASTRLPERLRAWRPRHGDEDAIAGLQAGEGFRRHGQHNHLAFSRPHPHAL